MLSDAALYLYQVSEKISLMILKLYYRTDKISIRKISKGHNFTKIVGGVTVLVICT